MVHAAGGEDGLQDRLPLAPRGGQADDPVGLLRVEEPVLVVVAAEFGLHLSSKVWI